MFPKNLDLRPFLGATLVQACLGMHQIQFRFDLPLALLAVECSWEVRGPCGAVIDQALEPREREWYRVHVLLPSFHDAEHGGSG